MIKTRLAELIIQQSSCGWTSGMRIFKDNHLKVIILVTKVKGLFLHSVPKPLFLVTTSHFCFYGSVLVLFYIRVNNTFKNTFKEDVLRTHLENMLKERVNNMFWLWQRQNTLQLKPLTSNIELISMKLFVHWQQEKYKHANNSSWWFTESLSSLLTPVLCWGQKHAKFFFFWSKTSRLQVLSFDVWRRKTFFQAFGQKAKSSKCCQDASFQNQWNSVKITKVHEMRVRARFHSLMFHQHHRVRVCRISRRDFWTFWNVKLETLKSGFSFI